MHISLLTHGIWATSKWNFGTAIVLEDLYLDLIKQQIYNKKRGSGTGTRNSNRNWLDLIYCQFCDKISEIASGFLIKLNIFTFLN